MPFWLFNHLHNEAIVAVRLCPQSSAAPGESLWVYIFYAAYTV